MTQFTEAERDSLYSLFRLDEHEIREGSTSKDKKKIQFFTYIRREAIQKRLDTSFFGEWELYFLDPALPCVYHKDHVDCSMGLAIRGVRREFNGFQSGTGEMGAKGAATDALKRVASLWGIGLYLQDSPQIWVENYVSYTWDDQKKEYKKGDIDWKKKELVEKEAMKKVEAWLKSIGANGNSIVNFTQGEAAQEESESSAPDPRDPDTHLGEKPDNWLSSLTELTKPLYDNKPHQDNSINKLISDNVIKRDMHPETAAAYVFMHCAGNKELGFNAEDVKAALGMTLSDFLKRYPRQFAKAWKLLFEHRASLDKYEAMPE